MKRWHLAWLAPALLGTAALALDRAFPPNMGRAGRLSAELRNASGRVLNLRTASDGTIRLAVGPAQAGRNIVPLLLAREDRRFWTMPGVDPLALARAAGQLVRNARVVSGKSTVAMQVARLLEPHPRTLWGKAHDMLRALQLQARIGPETFAGRLAAGARLRLPRSAGASAALALGGGGISPLDLAGLYERGTVVAPHVVGTSAAPGGPPLFSRRAAGAVAAILRGQPAPPGVAADPGHPIGYKTGTSYGYRDAWAAGFTPA